MLDQVLVPVHCEGKKEGHTPSLDVVKSKMFACHLVFQCKTSTNFTFSFGMFFIPAYLCRTDCFSHLFLESVRVPYFPPFVFMLVAALQPKILVL